jgi:hypothetical protein
MLDILFITIIIVFFALSFTFVTGLEKIKGKNDHSLLGRGYFGNSFAGLLICRTFGTGEI